MGYGDAVNRDVRWVLLVQALLTLLIAGGFAVTHGGLAALAALYGGAITLLLTAWLAVRVRRAGQTKSPAAGMLVIYAGTALRYASVIVLVGAGLGPLKLPALPLLVALAVTQFGFLAGLLAPRGATRSNR